MPVVIDVASQDFPDGAQRFNWCNCQDKAALAMGMRGLGDTPTLPAAPADAALTPIFDFSFWDQELTGGGAPTAAPVPSAPAGSLVLPGGTSVSLVGPALLAVGGLAIYFWASKKGRRR